MVLYLAAVNYGHSCLKCVDCPHIFFSSFSSCFYPLLDVGIHKCLSHFERSIATCCQFLTANFLIRFLTCHWGRIVGGLRFMIIFSTPFQRCYPCHDIYNFRLLSNPLVCHFISERYPNILRSMVVCITLSLFLDVFVNVNVSALRSMWAQEGHTCPLRFSLLLLQICLTLPTRTLFMQDLSSAYDLYIAVDSINNR